ncbi:hypothetical protein DXT90_03420 [Agrobacterium tumefaciens]|nr:hypothetical protein [Agrobacterium tumefaciens]
MKKIAIFTEGMTEQLFVLSALKFLANKQSLYIKRQRLHGGRKFPAMLLDVGTDEGSPDECELFYLLIDCANDERVVTAINENYEKLLSQGYQVILGVRDLRPDFSIEQLDKLVEMSTKSLPSGDVTPGLVVAVMEAEAWFLAEYGHFTRLDANLDLEKIRSELNIDLEMRSESFENPAQTLSTIYGLVGLTYTKSNYDVTRTIDAMDLAEFRLGGVFDRSESARLLFEHLEQSMRLP